jgi:hypothetical protein
MSSLGALQMFLNFGEKVGVWKGVGCGLIAAFGRKCCSWFPLRLPAQSNCGVWPGAVLLK